MKTKLFLSKQQRQRFIGVLNLLLALLFVLLISFPVLNLIWTSLRPDAETMAGDPTKFTFTLQNYAQLVEFRAFPFAKYFFNSIVVSLGSTFLALLLGIPAAYGLARFNIGGANMAFTILSFRIVPPIVFALPMFLLMRSYRLIDTYWALILSYLTFNLPLTVWVLRSFIKDIPIELDEAAMLDGASLWCIIVRVVVPLLGPGIFSVAVLNIIFSWNEFLFALILTSTKAATLTLGTARFITGYSVMWGPLSAASIVGMLPMILLGVLFQKRLVRGLTLGAVK